MLKKVVFHPSFSLLSIKNLLSANGFLLNSDLTSLLIPVGTFGCCLKASSGNSRIGLLPTTLFSNHDHHQNNPPFLFFIHYYLPPSPEGPRVNCHTPKKTRALSSTHPNPPIKLIPRIFKNLDHPHKISGHESYCVFYF